MQVHFFHAADKQWRPYDLLDRFLFKLFFPFSTHGSQFRLTLVIAPESATLNALFAF